MPNATATRSKSQQTRKTATANAARASINPQDPPYFNYSQVQREARIVPNKSTLGFSVQIREVAGEYGNLGQWRNADGLPVWALKPLLMQCGFLGGGNFAGRSTGGTTITQDGDGHASVDMADKVSVGSAYDR